MAGRPTVVNLDLQAMEEVHQVMEVVHLMVEASEGHRMAAVVTADLHMEDMVAMEVMVDMEEVNMAVVDMEEVTMEVVDVLEALEHNKEDSPTVTRKLPLVPVQEEVSEVKFLLLKILKKNCKCFI